MMTVKEIVDLAMARQTEKPEDTFYYGSFMGKVVKISVVATGKEISAFGYDWWLEHKNVPIEMLNENRLLIKEVWDKRLNLPYPPRYHTDELFRVNYELKRTAEGIGRLQRRVRETGGWNREMLKDCLSKAYAEEEKLQSRKRFILGGDKSKSIILADTKTYSIVSLLEGYGFNLIRSGNGRFKMLCPFHNEKTPSFTIFADTNRYKCFGCQEGGDCLDFVAKHENIGTIEAAKKLSAK